MYYAEAVAWAAHNGIVKGDANTGAFRPSDKVSRQEFAAMMARYAESVGHDVPARSPSSTSTPMPPPSPAGPRSTSPGPSRKASWARTPPFCGLPEDISRAAVSTMLVRFINNN